MKIFFYCRTGVHTSLITAAIHLGWLPTHRKVREAELVKLPYFDNIDYQLLGTPIFLGYDQFNNQVYTFGTWTETEVIPKAVDSLLKLHGIASDQYLLVNTLPMENLMIRLGVKLAVKFKQKRVSEALILGGLIKAYPMGLEIAQQLRQNLANGSERV